MADVANTFQTLIPMFKESYASGATKTHKRPGKEHNYKVEKFQNLKKKLKDK